MTAPAAETLFSVADLNGFETARTKRPRDWQRSRVYGGERDWKERGREFESLEEIRLYANEVLAVDRVVKPAHRYRHHSPVIVEDGRGRRSAYAYGHRRIAMPKWARCEVVALHEIAHLVVHRRGWDRIVASHGAEFVKVFLDLVGWRMGFDHREKLANCLRARRARWDRSDLTRWHPAHRWQWEQWAQRQKVTLPA